jgi:hypothetical protein
VKDLTKNIVKGSGLPKELKDQYDKKLAYIEKLIGASEARDQAVSGQAGSEQGIHEPFTCSLVQSIGKIPIPGVQTFGNVVLIPDFGTVTLGEIKVSERFHQGSARPNVYLELTAIKMELGCIGQGALAAGAVKANGHTVP